MSSTENLEIWKTTISSIIYFLQAVILLLPFFTDKFYDKRRSKKSFFKRLSKSAYAMIFMAGMVIALTITLDRTNVAISNNESMEADMKRNKSDSLNKQQLTNQGIRLSELLAKYGLKVDSTNQEIVKKLNDSSLRNKEIVKMNAPDPFLSIYSVRIKSIDSVPRRFDGQIFFELRSSGSDSFDVDAKIKMYVSLVNGKCQYVGIDDEVMPRGSVLSTNSSITSNSFIRYDKTATMVLIKFDATYRKSYANPTVLSTHEIYYFNLDNKEFGIPKGETLSRFKQFFFKDSILRAGN